MSDLEPLRVMLEFGNELASMRVEVESLGRQIARISEDARDDRRALDACIVLVNDLTVRTQAIHDMMAPVAASATLATTAQADAADRRALTWDAVADTLKGENALGRALQLLLTGLVTWYLTSLGVSS